MITVDKLSKNYGLTRALDAISFEVARGDVVGFLGPNGAGKSTTMKILTGFLLPSGGSAAVDGHDVVADSLQVRRRIGYLPESTPLYGEMMVTDYLRFAAEIRGVPGSRVKRAVDRVQELCGLQRVTGKDISELSKGYRQRVGLAQAMVHEPDVLILDEPTSGLDPNQIVEVRNLIHRLAEEHTVILSTHYLQEVEAAASRVIIISQGRIVADDSRERLVRSLSGGAIRLRVRGPLANILAQIEELMPGRRVDQLSPELDEAAARSPDHYHDLLVHVSTEPGDTIVPEALAQLVTKNGWALAEMQRQVPSLEDVFRSLTVSRGEEVGA